MPLGDFLCASLDQCNIPGLRERKKDFRLVNFICKIWQFYGNMILANLSICMANFGISNGRFQIAMLPISLLINITSCSMNYLH